MTHGTEHHEIITGRTVLDLAATLFYAARLMWVLKNANTEDICMNRDIHDAVLRKAHDVYR